MFFSNEDDDSDFMSPAGSSKLASLFGTANPTSDVSNESLKYTAPKEPKKKKTGESDDAKGGPQTKILSALAVHVYKYIDGKPETLGKLGAAILGNQESAEYKILLYKTKQQPVTQARITPSFVFTLQKNNYATIYDDSRTTFSLNFEGASQLEQFAKQISVAKAASAKEGTDNMISQDLCYGEGGQLENGDSVEMKYSAWLYEDGQIGESIDISSTETVRFKLGRGKVMKGWDEGVLGMRKGGKRMLIMPPSFGNNPDIKGEVPANSVIAYEVDILRVKLNKEREASPKESMEHSPSTTPVPEASSSASVEDKPVFKSDKAKLISRIAKMGQPMLPVTVPEHTEQEEAHVHEEEDGSSSASAQMKPGIPTKPTFQQQQHHPPSQPHTQPHQQHPQQQPHTASQPVHQPSLGQPANFYQQQPQQQVFQPVIQPGYNTVPGGVASHLAVYQPQPMQMPMQYGQAPPQYSNMYGQPYPHAATPPSASSEMVLSETRQNNTELRMSVSKVTEKVDRIFDKVETISAQQMQSSTSSMPNMEAGVLLHNITRIVQDNERLKQELFDKNNKIENQNEKINELIQRNQKYIEQSNLMLEQRSDTFKQTASSSQEKVLSLEQDKVKLTSELSASISQISSLQLEMTSLKKREMEIKQQLDSLLVSDQDQKTELSNLRVQNAENEKKLEQLSSQLKDEKRSRKEFELQHTTLQEEHLELQSTCQTLEKNLTEKRRKAVEERQKLEQELEELKSGLEIELADLREKLKKERTSTDVQTAEQVFKVEEDLTKEWKEKNERLLATAQERHKRALAEVQEEKQQLEDKVKVLEGRLSGLKSSRGETDEQMIQLREELDDMKVWKDKYDNLRGQASNMKEKYETRIGELEKEIETSHGEKQNTIEKARLAQTLLQSQLVELNQDLSTKEIQLKAHQQTNERQQQSLQQRTNKVPAEPDTEQLSSEVKKIMSSVYTTLRGKFTPETDYKGSHIHQTVLNTIKTVTLSMLSGDKSKEQGEDEEESEDESEDVESGEDDDDDDDIPESSQKPEYAKIVSQVEPAISKSKDIGPESREESPTDTTKEMNTDQFSINENEENDQADSGKEHIYENLKHSVSAAESEGNNDKYEKLILNGEETTEVQDDTGMDFEIVDKIAVKEVTNATLDIKSDDVSVSVTEDQVEKVEDQQADSPGKQTTEENTGKEITKSRPLSSAGKPTAKLNSADAKSDEKVPETKPLHAKKDVKSKLDSRPTRTLSATSRNKDINKSSVNSGTTAAKPVNGSLGNKVPLRTTSSAKATTASSTRASSARSSTSATTPRTSTIRSSAASQLSKTSSGTKPSSSAPTPGTSTTAKSKISGLTQGTSSPRTAASSAKTITTAPLSRTTTARVTSATRPKPSTTGTSNGVKSAPLAKTSVTPRVSSTATRKTDSEAKTTKSWNQSIRPSSTSAVRELKRPVSSTSSRPASTSSIGTRTNVRKSLTLNQSSSDKSAATVPFKPKVNTLVTASTTKRPMSNTSATSKTKAGAADKEVNKSASAKPSVATSTVPKTSKPAAGKDAKTESKPTVKGVKAKSTGTDAAGKNVKDSKPGSADPKAKAATVLKSTSAAGASKGGAAATKQPASSKTSPSKPASKATAAKAPNKKDGVKTDIKDEKKAESKGIQKTAAGENKKQDGKKVSEKPKDVAAEEQIGDNKESDVAHSKTPDTGGIKPLQASTAPVTGDRGNPYYAAELEKVNDSVMSASSTNTTAACKQTEVKIGQIQPEVSNITGDKGNPYYAAELEDTKKDSAQGQMISVSSVQSTGAGKPLDSKTDLIKPKDSKVEAEKANITGDKGNPYYAAELEKAKIESESVSKTTSGVPSIKQDEDKPKEAPLKVSEAKPTGDKGNPYYAEELEKLSKKDKPVTKDEKKTEVHGSINQSNIQATKISDTKCEAQIAEPCIQVVQVQSTMSAPPISPEKKTEVSSPTKDKPPKHNSEKDKAKDGKKDNDKDGKKDNDKDGKKDNDIDGKNYDDKAAVSSIHDAKAPVTGDKGNPYYASELEKGISVDKNTANVASGNKNDSKDKTITSSIHADKANITGDKGNPYYAEELEKMPHGQQMTAEKISISKAVPTNSAVKAEADIIKPEIIAPQKAAVTHSGNTKVDDNKTSEQDISSKKANVTGDKGNPYYAKELEESACKEKVTETTAKPVEIKATIDASKAPVTGDRGNPYYAAELLNLSKSNKDHKDDKDSSKSEKSNTKSEPVKAEEIKSTTAAASTALPPNDKDDKHKTDEIVKAEPIQSTQASKTTSAVPVNKEEKSGKDEIKVEQIQSTQVCATSAAPVSKEEKPVTSKSDQNKDSTPDVEKSKAPITGDRGNPNYAAELENSSPVKSSAEVASTQKDKSPVKPSSSQPTGDKGNPYYAMELDQAAKDKDAVSVVVRTSLEGAESVQSTSKGDDVKQKEIDVPSVEIAINQTPSSQEKSEINTDVQKEINETTDSDSDFKDASEDVDLEVDEKVESEEKEISQDGPDVNENVPESAKVDNIVQEKGIVDTFQNDDGINKELSENLSDEIDSPSSEKNVENVEQKNLETNDSNNSAEIVVSDDKFGKEEERVVSAVHAEKSRNSEVNAKLESANGDAQLTNEETTGTQQAVKDNSAFANQNSDESDEEDLFKPIPKERASQQDISVKGQDKADDKEKTEEDNKPAGDKINLEDSDSDDDLFKPIPKVRASMQESTLTKVKGGSEINNDSKDLPNQEKEKDPIETEDKEDPLFGASGVSSKTASTKSSITKKTSTTLVKNNDAAPLFGEDIEEDGDFNFKFTSKQKDTKKAEKKSKKLDDSDSDDFKEKPSPPPLFGDDDDDDDLDWLSK